VTNGAIFGFFRVTV